MKKLVLILFLFSKLIYSQSSTENLFGFATSNTFTYCDIHDTSFINKVLALSPKVLRFPGGAVGNYYHYGKSGYGFDLAEIDKYDGGRFPKRVRGLLRSASKKGHEHDYIEDFIKLAKITNAKAILVANMFVDNDDIIKMIQKIRSHNIQIEGVELGSELSNRTFFFKGYTIDDYIFAAQKCSDKIKNHFPDIKTAIVAAPFVKKKTHRNNKWNAQLAKMDFYDAIIIHSYAQVIKGKKEFGQMLVEIPEGDSNEEAYNIYKKRALKYFSHDYPEEVKMYQVLFKKPIWVTEWNLQISLTTGNTMLQSLFVAQYFMELLSNEELNSIELSTYHNMGGRDYGGSIFRNNKEILEIQSTFNSLKLIGEIFDMNQLKVYKEVIRNQVFRYNIYSNNFLKMVCIINWSDQFFKLNDTKEKRIKSFHSTNLYDKANISGELESTLLYSKTNYNLQPHSITLISYLNE